jgi:cyclase
LTLTKRIVPCLDVKDGRVVKGTHFENLRDAGDPVELAKRYSAEGADELVFLDISASNEKRGTLTRLVSGVASELDIPFTVGGGVRTVDDIRAVLLSGADKICLNTAAVEDPSLITRGADVFGAQCVVLAVDARRNYAPNPDAYTMQTREGGCWFEVYTYGGRKATGICAVGWSRRAVELSAGEILVTSMDRDGTKAGFDLELTRSIVDAINVPVIASGGAGEPSHFLEALTAGKADAALAASVFHYGNYPVPIVKRYLKQRGVEVRI